MAKILILGVGLADHAPLEATLSEAGHETLYSNATSAVDTIVAYRPALIIIDFDDPGFGAAEEVARLRAKAASIGRAPIIVLSPNNSVEERVSVLRAGGDECLSKPYAVPELLVRLRGLLTRALAVGPTVAESGVRTPGKVLVFYGTKGAVGTTTIAINTALSLRRLTGKRVALIDANFQFGDHRLFLDASLDRPAIDILADGEPFDAEKIVSIMHKDDSGIHALLAPTSPAQADLVTADHVAYILAHMRDYYDYIVVDLAQHIDDRCLRIIDAADELFLVLISELAGIKNTRTMLETLVNIDFPTERIHLIQNRVGAFTGISPSETARALGRPIDYSISNDYHSAVSALNSGHPTVNVKPESVLGQAFEVLVRRAILNEAPAAASSKKKGFFSH
jgi:pilus assembly protein CpaE